jgi:hypothetical protein
MAVSFLSMSLISCYKDTTDQASKQASKTKKSAFIGLIFE